MTTISPQAHRHTPTPSSVTSSSVVDSHNGYEDIFDRLETDLPVLLLSTTADEYDAQGDELSAMTEIETQSAMGKLRMTTTETQETEELHDDSETQTNEDFYSLTANDNTGAPFDFEQLRGKYVLICNVASMCGFSWQLKLLNSLHEKFKDDVVVLGFPSNSFSQEWFSAETATTCYKLVWDCHFKIMEKVKVNGKNQHQVFRYLKDQKKGFMGTKRVKWNFEKFLIDRDGAIIRRYSTLQYPQVIKADLDAILEKDLQERQAESTPETRDATTVA